jgi:tetratricopeptide (TPR) repeat protein
MEPNKVMNPAASNLKRVLVFIASPGDVSDSRNSIRHAVERINRLGAKDNGFLLEPIGWEDIPPGKGQRPQDIINPYVDAASIFVGILHRRFGQPTGVAESGTEEEYNRIEQRWKNEEPKPEVLIYFKIPDKQLVDHEEQLQKVLAFKERIRKTCLHKEFESERELEESVQDALHDWIVKNRNTFETPSGASSLVTLQPNDKEILACVAEQGTSSIEAISSKVTNSTPIIEASIRRLQNLGLVVEEAHGVLKPINSLEGFLAIVRQLNTDEHYKILLSSRYCQNMLNSSLEAHILSRFHLKLDARTVECLQNIALLSSRATSSLLFGDTSLYDNLFESIRDKDDKAQEFANGLMLNRLVLSVLLEYGVDYTNGSVLTELKSKRLAGQVLSMDLKVAYEEANAFGIGVAMPMIGATAGCDLKAGEMCYGRPEFGIRTGTIYMHLDMDELAEQQFDEALSQKISDSARALALNNKGLIYLKRNLFPEAILLFEQAIKHDPTLDASKKNLEFAKARLSEQKEDKRT